MPNAGGLTDREAAIDAMIRLLDSLDSSDADMCFSSVTHDMILDLTPMSVGGSFQEVLRGRDTVVNTLMSTTGAKFDTTHSATNIRCTVDGDSAHLTTCVLAQHFRKGEGWKPECQDYYFTGTQQVATIVRVEDSWRVSKLIISPGWAVGNPEVMKI